MMELKEFFGKFASSYLWGNLLAMLLVVVVLCLGVKFGLDLYTHHGEGIRVPKIEGMDNTKARLQLENLGLTLHVSDSGYNKKLPASVILAQSPGPGAMVKEGHVVYVTVNSPSSPSFAIPDIIDNSSFREAEAKLMAMGFRLLPPKRIVGEKDWVYGIRCHGRDLSTGDHVSIETPLTLIIGNGTYDEEDADIYYTDPIDGDGSDYDDFEDVGEPDLSGGSDTEIDDSGLSDL